ncbi:MAG: histidine phosphatase family protein [Actinomycetes bacterium]|tara:strand:- start:364 stop:1044 length:681 start_codon:yes stop_codon:yes gene_type:complete
MRAQKTATIYLLRHGHSTANAKSVLAGRDFKVSLSTTGEKQALALRSELINKTFTKIYSSPLPRCIQTLEPIAAAMAMEVEILDGAIEMEYGDWSGKKLALLSRTKLWKSIQERPSLVRFPNGESFLEMQNRALEAVRVIAIPGKTVLLCSHGDVIKAIVAGFLGLHLDNFQSLSIDPASISVIDLTGDSARIRSLNNTEYLSELKFTGSGSRNLNLGGGGGAIRE